ncbi:MAG: hypothetical protein CBC71_05915 [Rhodobacteraceae bacterium TMED111]|nr:MAG: hypothetical protein CBC71_05915 [Rhodobacteraceae bacterium TMED111]|tara:strand:+ start:5969 stop:7021 length:1053 start_codon:yes stop_codon:yes gene_type:complete
MAFEKVEYTFPDPDADAAKQNIEIEDSSAIEVDLSGKKEEKDEPKANGAEDKGIKKATPKDELEIEVVDDTPKADRNRKPSEPPEEVTDEELEDYSEKVRKRIQHFSKGYHDERRAKEAALRERDELERFVKSIQDENSKLKGSVNKNQTALIEQAKKTAEIELTQAKNAYKTAYDAGDTDAVIAAQESITNAKIKTDRLNNFKVPSLQEEADEVKSKEGSKPAAPTVDPRAQDWAKKNTWFGTDDEMTSLALGLHNKLAKQGVDLQSDEYYEAIDTRMRQLFPDKFEEEIAETEEAEKPKKQANVVAPATRSIAPKKVKLNRTQVAIAKRLGVPIELYAQKVAEEMRKE